MKLQTATALATLLTLSLSLPAFARPGAHSLNCKSFDKSVNQVSVNADAYWVPQHTEGFPSEVEYVMNLVDIKDDGEGRSRLNFAVDLEAKNLALLYSGPQGQKFTIWGVPNTVQLSEALPTDPDESFNGTATFAGWFTGVSKRGQAPIRAAVKCVYASSPGSGN